RRLRRDGAAIATWTLPVDERGEEAQLGAEQHDANDGAHRSIRARMQRENLAIACDGVVGAASLVEQSRKREDRIFIAGMGIHPALELSDRAGAVAAPRQLEDAVLHCLAWRSLAIPARPQFGDA